jgi:hypothetical protein
VVAVINGLSVHDVALQRGRRCHAWLRRRQHCDETRQRGSGPSVCVREGARRVRGLGAGRGALGSGLALRGRPRFRRDKVHVAPASAHRPHDGSCLLPPPPTTQVEIAPLALDREPGRGRTGRTASQPACTTRSSCCCCWSPPASLCCSLRAPSYQLNFSPREQTLSWIAH